MGAKPKADFEAFALLAWPRLRWSAYLLCGDHHLAEDLAQTALARTYSAWKRIRHDDPIAYSRKILINLNVDRIRRRRIVEVGTEHLSEQTAQGSAVQVEQRQDLLRMLLGLSQQERSVVVLRHYFDLSEAQVSAELGIPRGTVKSTLSRALAKLRVTAETTANERR